jgi:hypothetical protein
VLHFLRFLPSACLLIFLLCPSFSLLYPYLPSSTAVLFGTQLSSPCPQSAPFSSYSAVPSTTFLSFRPHLRSSHKGGMYQTTSYARRGLMACPSVPEETPTAHVSMSSKSNWVLWCRSSCRTSVSPARKFVSTFFCNSKSVCITNSYMVQSNTTVVLFSSYMFRSRSAIIRQ